MPLNNPYGTINWAAEGMAPAIPWCTSSVCTGVRKIEFDRVSKFVVVTNESTNVLRVGFTEHGLMTSSNYIELETDEVMSAEICVKELWLSGSGNTFQMLAGMSTVHPRNFEQPSSGSGYGGVG